MCGWWVRSLTEALTVCRGRASGARHIATVRAKTPSPHGGSPRLAVATAGADGEQQGDDDAAEKPWTHYGHRSEEQRKVVEPHHRRRQDHRCDRERERAAVVAASPESDARSENSHRHACADSLGGTGSQPRSTSITFTVALRPHPPPEVTEHAGVARQPCDPKARPQKERHARRDSRHPNAVATRRVAANIATRGRQKPWPPPSIRPLSRRPRDGRGHASRARTRAAATTSGSQSAPPT